MSTAEADLIDRIASYKYDPLGFVNFVFDWGYGELAKFSGPDTWQRELLVTLGEELARVDREGGAVRLAVTSGHSIGKAQPVDLVVETPDGPRRWGDLRVGDRLFGLDGKPTRITAVHPQGVKPVYRVTLDDETSTLACAEHLWRVRHRKKGWLTASTQELAEMGVKRKNGAGRLRAFALPTTGAVEYPYRWVPVDPYTLGAWLGDGCRKTSRITNMDMEVFDRIRLAGYRLTEGQSKTNGRARVFNIGHLRPALERLGVDKCGAYEKFVPEIYKRNLPEIRAEVLRGLIDTDGYVNVAGSCIFTSASKRLVEDVMWLCRSLGGKAMLTGRPGAWNATLTFPEGFMPCYVKRKAERIRPETRKRYRGRYIDRIEPAGDAECMCVTVDAEDSLYLCNDFIPTHNSALIAWIILFFMSTQIDAQIIVTANTKTQLETKTWRELAKWHNRIINKNWFERTATKFYQSDSIDTWFASAIPWSKDNPEAFAGAGDVSSRTIFLFDEASGIDDSIHETSEGAMLRPGTVKIAFSNPTRNYGWFRECFRKYADRWKTWQIDSRECAIPDKSEIQGWIEDYGDDSDWVRVRAKGQFPRAGSMQFISSEIVQEAVERKAEGYEFAPKVLGVDVARYGDDRTVITMRQGTKVWPQEKHRGLDTIQVGKRVAQIIDEFQPHVTFVDGIGIGAGVVDYLKHTGYDVIDVIGSASPLDGKTYLNTRVECWGLMRDGLRTSDLPDDEELFQDLTGPEYAFNAKMQIVLEKKEDLKKKGLNSPDCGDSLALTFASNVEISAFYEDEDEDDSWMDEGRSAATGY